MVIVRILFKWVTTGVFAVVTLVSAAIIYVSMAVDINSFKPDIETQARQQGWDIAIEDGLAWAFFPRPGITINGLRFADQSFVSGNIDSLTLAVSWLDLLISGGHINRLQGASVQINDGELLYRVPNSLPVRLDNIHVKTSSIGLDGTSFPITVSMEALGGQQFAIDTDIAIVASNDKVQSLSLANLRLRLNDIEFNGNIDASNSLRFIQGNLQTNTFSLASQLQLVAKILPIFSMPKMANSAALSKLSVHSSFTLDTEALSDISNVMILDGQTIEVDLEIDHPRDKLTTIVAADVIRASDYLPEPGSNTDNSGLFAPLAIPFALWRGRSQVEMTIGSIEFNGFALNDFYSNVFGNNRVLRLTSLNADLFGGQINAIAKLDMRQTTPSFNIQPSLTNIDLSPALINLAGNADVTGSLSLQANIQGSGNNHRAIVKSLTGDGQFDIVSPNYAKINLEQTFCTAASLFGGSNQPAQRWAKGTQLDEMNGRFRFTNGKLLISDYSAATGNLTIDGNATVRILEQEYNLKANTLLSSSTTSNNGCSVNRRLQNRPIPFICKGSLGKNHNSKSTSASCKPDERALKDLLKNSAVDKLSEQLFKYSDDDQNPVQNLLQDLLKKNLR